MARIIASQSAEGFATKFLPPVSEGLLAWHFLNGSLEKAARNYAIGKPDASIVGAPTIGAGSVGFKGLANFLQTSIEEVTTGTYYMIGKTTDTRADNAHNPMYFGTFQSPAASGGGNTFGVSMAWSSPSVISGFASRGTSTADDTSAAAQLTNLNPNTWALYCLRTPGVGQGNVLTNLTTGAEAVGPAGADRLRSTGRFRIGSGYQTYEGLCDMAHWSAFAGYHTTEQMAAVYKTLKPYAAKWGITV